ncbi:uncharacterized protein [Diabrotica undecimpunctata]|uniref:uncharacterized protein n=1 Tax=Diabrotica undecimpunctata TaxID=50387 RepID=UPI003B641B23
MDTLKKKRSTYKAQFTRIEKWYSANTSCDDKHQLLSRIDLLKENLAKYDSIQNEIELLDSPSDSEDREEYENKCLDLKCTLQAQVEALNQVSSRPDPDHFSRSGHSHMNIKLPNIHLPTFSGNCIEYPSFIDLFRALIVNNSQLSSNVEKFFYLKSYLKGEALKLIDRLPVTDDNLVIPLDLLHSRYSNQRQIIRSYYQQLLATPTLQKCTSQSLRQFVANSKAILDALDTVKLSKAELFESLLVHLLEQKLDYSTRRSFEEQVSVNELPSIDDFFHFLSNRCVVLENINSENSTAAQPTSKVTRFQGNDHAHPSKFKVAFHSQSNPSSQMVSKSKTYTSPPKGCGYCLQQNHRIYSCTKFCSLPVSDRIEYSKANKLCFNCLGSKHFLQNCGSKSSCSLCHSRHHSLLHNTRSSAANTDTPIEPSNHSLNHGESSTRSISHTLLTTQPEIDQSSVVHENNFTSRSTVLSTITTHDTHVLLATAKVHIYPVNGRPILARAILDSGSQSSFITESLAKSIGCKRHPSSLHISGILNDSNVIKERVTIDIFPRNSSAKRFTLSCAVIPSITNCLPQIAIDIRKFKIPSHILNRLADEEFGQPAGIDLLIGADAYYELLLPGLEKLGKGLPSLIQTQLGWVVSGSVPLSYLKPHFQPHPKSYTFHSTLGFQETEESLNETLDRFFQQEQELDISKSSEQDELAEAIFVSTTKILKDGSYQVDLPLIHPLAHKELGDSFMCAKNRFLSLEKKFVKHPFLKEEYRKILMEYIELGHGREVPLALCNSKFENKYFVPHLADVRDQSSTTKMRVVFDFSAKTTSALSLNDITLRGPKVQPELFEILTRFRTHKFAFTADITKMYRQVKLNPSFHFLQNALWRETPQDQFSCIELTTVSFGQKSAPYLACRVLKDIAQNTSCSTAVKDTLLYQTYVDDILSGCSTEKEIISLRRSLSSTLSSAGFSIHKIRSNSSLAASSAEFSSASKDILPEKGPCKVLGIKWDPATDVFQVATPESLTVSLPTKRKILSVIAQCYDPLGFVNPVIVHGKILMQQIWAKNLSWDHTITDPDLLDSWFKFLSSLTNLSSFSIPRCIIEENDVIQVELHGFCDASTQAYGCCMYLRAEYSDSSVSSTLIAAKSRVAPVRKPLTIPKLELCAMVLLTSLYTKLYAIISRSLTISDSILWSDSMVALSWAHSPSKKWSTFVANRVEIIQNASPSPKWKHIKSELNPADLLSRGKLSDRARSFWASGPPFLLDRSSYLFKNSSFEPMVNLPEEKKGVNVYTKTQKNCWIEYINRFSSFTKLIKSMAYIRRFVYNARHKDRLSDHLSPKELQDSRLFLIRQVQTIFFKSEILSLTQGRLLLNKQIASLNPFLDRSTLLRVGGRLKYSDVPFDQRHPLLLPARNQFTTLLLTSEHQRLGHAGSQTTLNNVRLRYWPLDGLRCVKRIIHSCNTCFRFNAIASTQIMGDLPRERVTSKRPFENTGIDFGGPFCIKSSSLRRAPTSKGYIALFVCLATKAVHLEAVSDLTTDAFLACLKRFIARRGILSIIYSDNGTNFVGANNHLTLLRKHFSTQPHVFHEFLASHNITWKFIPPRSPHWGGL